MKIKGMNLSTIHREQNLKFVPDNNHSEDARTWYQSPRGSVGPGTGGIFLSRTSCPSWHDNIKNYQQ